MSPFCILFLCSVFNPCIGLIITKTATIDPNTPNLQNNGATIIELDVETSYSNPTEWRLYNPNNNNGFHLQLNLDSSWGFHISEDSNLTIEVNADKNTIASTQYNELIVAFTQTNSNKFFTTKISIDQIFDHRFYPPCILPPLYNGQIVNGDVKQIVDIENNGYDRYYKATSDGENWTYGPFLESADRNVEPPLTFMFFYSP
eukprot:315161_1